MPRMTLLALDETGAPATGLVGTIAWATYVNALTGDAISPEPSFVESPEEDGIYYADVHEDATGVADLGAGMLDRYHGLLLRRSDVVTILVVDEDGAPVEGLTPSWSSFIDIDTGTVLSDPAAPDVAELEGGLYKFTPNHFTVHAVGTIAPGGAAFPAALAYDGLDLMQEEIPVPVPAPEAEVTLGTGAAAGGDFALTWDIGDADLAIVDDDLQADPGLRTAVLLSLFTDRRAAEDDPLPGGDDRRGWWADEFAEVNGDRLGSRLWLLDRAKRTDDVARLAEEYDREALAWMLEDRIAERIDVAVEADGSVLRHRIDIWRPGAEDPVSFRFAPAWAGEQARGAL